MKKKILCGKCGEEKDSDVPEGIHISTCDECLLDEIIQKEMDASNE